MKSLLEYQTLYETFQNKKLKFDKPKNLYEPVEHIMHIAGKRMRPALVLMGCEIFEGDVKTALPIALAVEVFHNFTLVHDDIMDCAPLRRNVPTVHTKFGINAGILSGDVMLIYAYKYIADLKISPLTITFLLRAFNDAAIKVCEGQQLDMDFETRKVVSEEDYIKMIGYKTAALVGVALQMGALATEAKPEAAQILYNFGYNVGVAFQIHDDILDSFGNPATFGKKVGGDIAQNKKTLLVIETLDLGTAQQKKELQKLMSVKNRISETEKIEHVKILYLKSGALEAVTKKREKYIALAFENLQKLNISSDKKEYLKAWANDLMQRVK